MHRAHSYVVRPARANFIRYRAGAMMEYTGGRLAGRHFSIGDLQIRKVQLADGARGRSLPRPSHLCRSLAIGHAPQSVVCKRLACAIVQRATTYPSYSNSECS